MTAAVPDVQSIRVSVSPADLTIEPGDVAHLSVTMTNGQAAPDRLSIEIEGIDVEWYAIPVAAVNVAAGAETTERVVFRVARTGGNRAGTYPFLVRVQAMESGEVGVAQAALQVKQFSDLQLDLSPRRAVSTFFHPHNAFEVTISNNGNSEESLELYASDPDEGCTYEFDTDRAALKPGQARALELTTHPRSLSLLAGTRLYGFTVSARSTDDAYVTANTHGQIEKHALISPLLGIFLVLVAGAALGWAAFKPRPLPPLRINQFASDTTRVADGHGVTLTWDVSPEFSQLILQKRVGLNGTEINEADLKNAVGNYTAQPVPPYTDYTLIERGTGNQKQVDRSIRVYVSPAPAPPRPTLRTFYAQPAAVHLGESTMLYWDGRAKSYVLDPGSTHLDGIDRSHAVTPDHVGDVVYTLRAIGQDETASNASRNCTVHVVGKDQSLAVVDRFQAPSTVYIGVPFRLRWRTSYSVQGVRLEADHGSPMADTSGLPASGSELATITDPTTFTLTATDSLGLPVTKRVTITPVAPPPPKTAGPPPDQTNPPIAPAPGASPGSGSGAAASPSGTRPIEPGGAPGTTPGQ